MDTYAKEPLLDRMFAETERAWIDRRDASVVDRLAAEHPEHATELYELFSALLFGSSLPGEPAQAAAARTRAWLEEEGLDRARHVARQERRPPSFVRFLQQRTGEPPDAIARRIGDVSWEFLVQVSRYPSLVPAPVRQELADRIGRRWSVGPEECLDRIEASGLVPRAASRRQPFPPEPASFEDLLARSSLGRKQRSYWAGLASA